MSIPLLTARGVTKSYGQGELTTQVLRGVDLELHPGELVLLMGPSGSGKTTLLSILAGLLRPSSGEVALCGKELRGLSELEVTRLRRERLGFVFQGDNLFPALSAKDNVAEVLVLKGVPRREAGARARAALEAVGLGHRLEQLPKDLSGGEKQRVAVARALAGDPALVLGDEVTSALDWKSAEAVVELLRTHPKGASGGDETRGEALRARPGCARDESTECPRFVPAAGGAAVLLVTHDPRLLRWADRVIEIEDGRIGKVTAGGASRSPDRRSA